MEKYRLICITSQGTLCWGYCNLDVLTLNDVSLNSLCLKYSLEDSSEFINKRWLCPYCVFSTEVGDQQMFIDQWARPGSGKVMQIDLILWLKRQMYWKASVKCAMFVFWYQSVMHNCGSQLQGLGWHNSNCPTLGFLYFSDPSLPPMWPHKVPG